MGPGRTFNKDPLRCVIKGPASIFAVKPTPLKNENRAICTILCIFQIKSRINRESLRDFDWAVSAVVLFVFFRFCHAYFFFGAKALFKVCFVILSILCLSLFRVAGFIDQIPNDPSGVLLIAGVLRRARGCLRRCERGPIGVRRAKNVKIGLVKDYAKIGENDEKNENTPFFKECYVQNCYRHERLNTTSSASFPV